LRLLLFASKPCCEVVYKNCVIIISIGIKRHAQFNLFSSVIACDMDSYVSWGTHNITHNPEQVYLDKII
jgi:hypothetical protein